MAQSRIYLRCIVCDARFYFARLNSCQDPEFYGCYDRITSEDLQKFFDDHGHNKVNGEQFLLEYN